MQYLPRLLEKNITETIASGKSILLLGPRQTGKTTLINQIPVNKNLSLADLKNRLRYEKEPFILTTEIEALREKNPNKLPIVIIDEIQKLPILMDAVQDLIDRKIAQFILTGSSARQLKRKGNVNLLPGRVIPLRLDPLTLLEQEPLHPTLDSLLLYGSLPEISLTQDPSKQDLLLEAYTTIYLEEEIRAEAIVRDIGHFARFLELAASESGKIINFSKLSQEIGVAHSTIINYYQILEDCLVAERIEPLTVSKTRHKLSKAQKYLLYDLGVRRIAAREGNLLSKERMGDLFEQYVGLEIIRALRLNKRRSLLKYWRDPSGPEIDWIIDLNGQYIPIEVKWTDLPKNSDIKHLQIFLNEYPQATKGFVICRTPCPIKLSANITALPWNDFNEIFELL